MTDRASGRPTPAGRPPFSAPDPSPAARLTPDPDGRGQRRHVGRHRPAPRQGDDHRTRRRPQPDLRRRDPVRLHQRPSRPQRVTLQRSELGRLHNADCCKNGSDRHPDGPLTWDLRLGVAHHPWRDRNGASSGRLSGWAGSLIIPWRDRNRGPVPEATPEGRSSPLEGSQHVRSTRPFGSLQVAHHPWRDHNNPDAAGSRPTRMTSPGQAEVAHLPGGIATAPHWRSGRSAGSGLCDPSRGDERAGKPWQNGRARCGPSRVMSERDTVRRAPGRPGHVAIPPGVMSDLTSPPQVRLSPSCDPSRGDERRGAVRLTRQARCVAIPPGVMSDRA